MEVEPGYKEWLRKNPEYIMTEKEIGDFYIKNSLYLSSKNRVDTNFEIKRITTLRLKKPQMVDGRMTSSEWLMITVNPRSEYDQTPFKFFNAVHNAFKCKLFTEGTYVFEQRSTIKGVYKGYHTHAVLKRNCAKSHLTRELKRKFSSFCDINDTRFFRIEEIYDLENAHKYLVDKESAKKQSKSQIDCEMRAYHGLLDKYNV